LAARAGPRRWRRLIGETRGVTAMEYALIGSLIAIAIVVAASQLGNTLANTFGVFANSL